MQVVCSYVDDVVIVAQLASLCAETEVRGLGQFDLLCFEAFRPLVHILVLKIYAEGCFSVVGHSNFGRNCAGASNPASLSSIVSACTNALDGE